MQLVILENYTRFKIDSSWIEIDVIRIKISDSICWNYPAVSYYIRIREGGCRISLNLSRKAINSKLLEPSHSVSNLVIKINTS